MSTHVDATCMIGIQVREEHMSHLLGIEMNLFELLINFGVISMPRIKDDSHSILCIKPQIDIIYPYASDSIVQHTGFRWFAITLVCHSEGFYFIVKYI
jgi:hypothetical protein